MFFLITLPQTLTRKWWFIKERSSRFYFIQAFINKTILVIPELPKKEHKIQVYRRKPWQTFYQHSWGQCWYGFVNSFTRPNWYMKCKLVTFLLFFCLLHIIWFFYVIFLEHILQWTWSLLQKYAIIDVFQKVFTYFKAPINLCNFCVYLKTFFAKFDLILLSSYKETPSSYQSLGCRM